MKIIPLNKLLDSNIYLTLNKKYIHNKYKKYIFYSNRHYSIINLLSIIQHLITLYVSIYKTNNKNSYLIINSNLYLQIHLIELTQKTNSIYPMLLRTKGLFSNWVEVYNKYILFEWLKINYKLLKYIHKVSYTQTIKVYKKLNNQFRNIKYLPTKPTFIFFTTPKDQTTLLKESYKNNLITFGINKGDLNPAYLTLNILGNNTFKSNLIIFKLLQLAYIHSKIS